MNIAVPIAGICSSAGPGLFDQGVSLYNAGRYSEAMEVFDNAVKKRDHAEQSQRFMERIRKETVERIRNQALVGISKTNWQSKFFYIRSVGNRLRVGLSTQETFEPQSLNFRPGAADALMQLAAILQRNDNAVIDLDLISERPVDAMENPELLNRRLTETYSFLSLGVQDALPDYQTKKTVIQ